VQAPKLIGNICIALTKLSRVGLDGCDVLHISRTYPQLWSCFVVVGDIVHRAPRRLRWAPHNLVRVPVHHPPCLHLWPSVITWRRRNPANILLLIQEWNTWIMGLRMQLRCWWASPEIKFQNPSNMPSGTSTFSRAPFWNPSSSLTYS
jgi:hypothetical protein